MKKIIMALSAVIVQGVIAQEVSESAVMPKEPTAQEIAASPVVDSMLSLEEDGVSLVTAPDGSFRIFTIGTGVYRFSDPQVELNARKVARLKAERNLAKFISTKIEGTDGTESLAKNSCVLNGDGQVQSTQASSELLEDIKGQITSRTSAVLSGLVVVESKKVPDPGKTSGVIQVKMVYSSKTGKAAEWIGRKMKEHQDALNDNGSKSQDRIRQSTSNHDRGKHNGLGGNGIRSENNPEHRVNKTEF